MATDPETGHAAGAKPPTALARRYVQYVVGFGVAVGVGLAPFLGKVAGVDALLNLFPPPLRASLIPISAFLMGLIAVAIQFYSGETLRPATIRKRFGVSWLLLLAGLLLLFFLYGQFVVSVPTNGGKEIIPVVIGDVRIQGGSCGCPPTSGTIECIQRLTVNPAAIETCWDTGSIRFRSQLLSLSYLLVTGGFGALIGLLLLQEEAKKKQKRRPRKAAV